MTGRDGPGPKDRSATPGCCDSVAPSVACSCLADPARQDGRRLIRLELVPGVRTDRHDFAVMQFRVNRHIQGYRRGGNVQLRAGRHEAGCDDEKVVGAGRDVGNGIASVSR